MVFSTASFDEMTGSPDNWAKISPAVGPSSSRIAIVMSVAVTPLNVAPPLSPLKVTHGGEYGSPGTCWARSGHGCTPPPDASAPPGAGPPPAAVAVGPPAGPAASVAPGPPA